MGCTASVPHGAPSVARAPAACPSVTPKDYLQVSSEAAVSVPDLYTDRNFVTLNARLGLGKDAPIRLVLAKFLIELCDDPNGKLLRRQDIPEEAFASVPLSKKTPFIAISYPWRAHSRESG